MSIRCCTHLGSNTTVALFLAQGGSYPALCDTELRHLIDCQAIAHYTRSGTRTVVDAPSFPIQEGDFLVVPSSCSSGATHTLSTDVQTNEYAFKMGIDTGDNRFYEYAEGFMGRRPSTRLVTSCRTLESVLRTLSTDSQIGGIIGSKGP